MSKTQETPLAVAACGLLAGIAGAIVVSLIGSAYQKTNTGKDGSNGGGEAAASGAGPSAGITVGEALADGPDMPPNMNRVTATFVQKVATGIFGLSLNKDQRHAAGFVWHLMYGGFWGVIYGLLRSSLRLPSLVLSPLHGLLVWAVGPGWLVPKMKLMLPPGEQEPRTRSLVCGIHPLYSAFVAGVYHWLATKE